MFDIRARRHHLILAYKSCKLLRSLHQNDANVKIFVILLEINIDS
uniref:Uncharacterized protein n=1 Tax=Arundo donax TaxID=35708 RepID=A0A0A9H8M1_ARUDO